MTAACLLVSRTRSRGRRLRSDYEYGLEDVDLCLKLRAAGGRLVYDGRAALWHHESATRAADPAVRRSRVARNREAYIDAWGPRVFRAALLDASRAAIAYSRVPFHVAIVGAGTTSLAASSLGAAPRARVAGQPVGARSRWRARARPLSGGRIVADAALDIRLVPSRLVTLARIGGEPERWVERPWFDDYDIVLCARIGGRRIGQGAVVRRPRDRSARAECRVDP